MVLSTLCASPCGDICLTSDGTHLTGLYFSDDAFLRRVFQEGTWQRQDDLALFHRARTLLTAYFSGEKPNFLDLPLGLKATPFQRSVYEQLLAIPYGYCTSYGEIAKKLCLREGKTQMSAQAVGGACGRNPLAIIIPCHRVVGCSGALTGYRGGLERKRFLLRLEGCQC